jgi:hypothetical protein
LKNNDLKLGVLRRPIDGLIAYHIANKFYGNCILPMMEKKKHGSVLNKIGFITTGKYKTNCN